jgi:hypothetical protein
MAEIAVQEAAQPFEEFREQRKKKRILRDDQAQALREKKSSMAPPSVPPQVQTRNYYAPLRNKMVVGERQVSGTDAENQPKSQVASKYSPAEGAPGKAGRPPSIILTYAAKLIQLQNKIKSLAKQSLELRTTRNGTRVTTRDMVYYLAVKAHFDNTKMSYLTLYPKSLNPIKAVIRHLPHNTPEEDISDGLVDLGSDVITVKQMSSARRTPMWDPKSYPLITLPMTEKSQEIFKLPSLCHIAIKVEAYKFQNSLTQCYNCHKIGHAWANCKQPPRCL